MSDHALLSPQAHRDLRVRTDRGAALGDAVMACLTVPIEFRRVQNDYPILFRRGLDRAEWSALAMFGFDNGENLFLAGDRWDARYVPLAHATRPFLIGRAAPDAPAQVHVDLASPRLGAEGIRLFDEDARPTPYLEQIAEQLGELDEGYLATPAFFAALERYDLLEPLTLEVTLDDGSTNRLVGYHVIDEDRLRRLEPGPLADLHADDHLLPIFMALASLANLGALVARKNRLNAGG